jgi:hypothetical protein
MHAYAERFKSPKKESSFKNHQGKVQRRLFRKSSLRETEPQSIVGTLLRCGYAACFCAVQVRPTLMDDAESQTLPCAKCQMLREQMKLRA